jgi:hypothetical protein
MPTPSASDYTTLRRITTAVGSKQFSSKPNVRTNVPLPVAIKLPTTTYLPNLTPTAKNTTVVTKTTSHK